MKTKVIYKGFLQTIERDFDTPQQAETWLRQVGKWSWFRDSPAPGVEVLEVAQ